MPDASDDPIKHSGSPVPPPDGIQTHRENAERDLGHLEGQVAGLERDVTELRKDVKDLLKSSVSKANFNSVALVFLAAFLGLIAAVFKAVLTGKG